MKTNMNDLRESNGFLNLILDNINSAVLIADENLQVHQFNDSFLSLFDNAATVIQQNLLPDSFPIIENVRAAWKYEPCEQIGGDIFNIHMLDESHIGLYMLDVCGHGVSAALMAVAVSQFFRNGQKLSENKSGFLPPEAVLTSLERDFPFERFDSYFTIIYMKIDLTQGFFTYSCAGHPPPILIHTNGILEVLERHGPVIGSGNGIPFFLSVLVDIRVRL